MPRFTVLSVRTIDGEQFVLQPLVAQAAPHAAGLRVVGTLQLPMSSQILTLSPPVLHIPGHGRADLSEILAGARIPGVTWLPMP